MCARGAHAHTGDGANTCHMHLRLQARHGQVLIKDADGDDGVVSKRLYYVVFTAATVRLGEPLFASDVTEHEARFTWQWYDATPAASGLSELPPAPTSTRRNSPSLPSPRGLSPPRPSSCRSSPLTRHLSSGFGPSCSFLPQPATAKLGFALTHCPPSHRSCGTSVPRIQQTLDSLRA